MKRARTVLFMLGMVTCCIVVACITRHTQRVAKSYDISIDPYLSPVTHINITDVIYTYNTENQSPRAVAQKLLDTFPCIRAVKTGINSQRLIAFTIEAQSPLFALNDTALMLENGTVVARASYNEAQVVGIKQITVAENQLYCLPASFKPVMENLFALSAEPLAITWICDREILVADQYNASLQLLCCVDALPDKKIMKECLHIYNDIKSQNTTSSKKIENLLRTRNKTWIADIRFKDQIVVRAEVGGHTYG